MVRYGLLNSTCFRSRRVFRNLLCCAVLGHSVMFDCLQPHGLLTLQAPLPMGLSRQEYCSGLPCPPPGDLPNAGTEPRSPVLQADSLPSEPQGKPSMIEVLVNTAMTFQYINISN